MSKAAAVKPHASTRPRGRPRSEAIRRRILRAAREIMDMEGFGGVNIEAIAARAGVGKPTVYRSWPNAQAVAMAAMLDSGEQPATARRAARGLQALRRQLHAVAKVFASPLGRNVTMMLASAEPDTELAKVFRHHFILARREEGREFLSQAISAGELRRDVELDVALDLIYAPVFYRLLVGHAPLDARFTDAVLDHALAGLKPRRRGR